MDFTVDLSNTGITADEIKEHKDEAASIMEALWSGRMDLSGWVKLPLYFEQRKMRNIVETAEKIGIRRERAANYDFSATGTTALFECLCDTVKTVRAGRRVEDSWAEKLKK